MKLSPNMDYFIVGVPKQAALWPSEEITMLREAIHASQYKPKRGNPFFVNKFDPKKITVKPIGRQK